MTTTTTTAVFPLQAQVWGLQGTGKRTLLQRLQGKDPFATTETTTTTTTTTTSNAGTSARGTSSSSSSSSPSVVVPYQVPRGLLAWDRIQLRVSLVEDDERDETGDTAAATTTTTTTTAEQQAIDFVVLLVDPRHDKERIQQHLSQCITTLLHRQGYPTTAFLSKSKKKKKKKTTNEQSASLLSPQQHRQQQHPFCLCLVLNFADQLQAKKKKKRQPDDSVTESDLQSMTMMILQEQCPTLLEPKHLLLQCTRTSLWNCYGLTQLHHFIYQCYLLTKQWQLQDMLQQVATAQQSSRQVIPPAMSYKDYVNSMDQMMNTTTTTAATGDANVVGNGKASKNTGQVKKVGVTEESSKSSSSSSRIRRKIGLPTNHNAKSFSAAKAEEPSPTPLQQPPPMDPTSALEAFLASDDEEDAGIDQPSRPAVYDSSSDDDDDVFFDEAGRRRSKRQEERATTPSKNSGAAEQESFSSSNSSSISRRDIKTNLSDSEAKGGGAATGGQEEKDDTETSIAQDDDSGHNSVSKSGEKGEKGSPRSDNNASSSVFKDKLADKNDAVVGNEPEGSDNPTRQTPVKEDSDEKGVYNKSSTETSFSSESSKSPKNVQGEASDENQSRKSSADIIDTHEEKIATEERVDGNGESASPEMMHYVKEAAKTDHGGNADADHDVGDTEEASAAESVEVFHSQMESKSVDGVVPKAEMATKGWGDDGELASVEENESLPPVPSAENRAESLESGDDANAHAEDISSATNVDNQNTSGMEQGSVELHDEEEKSSAPSKTSAGRTVEFAGIAGKTIHDEDEDDDNNEFFIGGEEAVVPSTSPSLQDGPQQNNGDKKLTSPKGSPPEAPRSVDDGSTSVAQVYTARPNETKKEYSKVDTSIAKMKSTPKETASHTGLSAAALAAIAAAQEEAQLMLHEQEGEKKEEEKRSKKSKKEKKEKKEKKKKKSKRSETSSATGSITAG